MSTSSTTTISERFIIDFLRKQIIGTKASFDKASKGTGAIYEELATKVAKHPDFKLVVKEQKKHISKPKKVYDGLTFEFISSATKSIAYCGFRTTQRNQTIILLPAKF